MNAGLKSLVPHWLRQDEEDWKMPEELPPIAMLPQPKMKEPETDEEKRLAAIATAHVYVEQLRQDRAADKAEIEQLKSDLKAEQRKSGLLELDIAQHLNTIATLQSEVLALKEKLGKFENFFSVQKQINEKERQTYMRFEIGDPPPKENKPRPRKPRKKPRMNHETSLSLFVLLIAGIGVALLITCVPVPARDICLTKKEARHLWPRQHIYWYSSDHCWSNRRGPPRHIKIEKEKEPEPKKIRGTDPVFPPKAKAIDPNDVNELDAMAKEAPVPFIYYLSDKFQGWAIWWGTRVGELFK